MKICLLEITQGCIPVSLRTLANYACKFLKTDEDIEYIYKDIYQLSFTSNSFKEELAYIKKQKPNLICLTIWIWNYLETIELSKLLKKELPEIPIVLGGLGVFYPENFLKNNPQFDLYCYEKQGEEVFIDILEYYLNKRDIQNIDGICYIKDTEFYINKRHIRPIRVEGLYGIFNRFPIESFLENTENYVPFEIVRGCSNGCAYCSWGEENRSITKDPIRITEEINSISPKLGVFFSDATALTPEFLEVYRQLTCKKWIYLFVSGSTPLNIESSKTIVDGIPKFKNVLIEIGIQSFNEKVLNYLNREVYLEVLEYWKKVKNDFPFVELQIDLIAGLPFQTLEDIKNNMCIAKKYGNTTVFSLVAFPNTKVWKEHTSWGAVFNKEYPYNLIKTDYLTEEEVIALQSINNSENI